MHRIAELWVLSAEGCPICRGELRAASGLRAWFVHKSFLIVLGEIADDTCALRVIIREEEVAFFARNIPQYCLNA